MCTSFPLHVCYMYVYVKMCTRVVRTCTLVRVVLCNIQVHPLGFGTCGTHIRTYMTYILYTFVRTSTTINSSSVEVLSVLLHVVHTYSDIYIHVCMYVLYRNPANLLGTFCEQVVKTLIKSFVR